MKPFIFWSDGVVEFLPTPLVNGILLIKKNKIANNSKKGWKIRIDGTLGLSEGGSCPCMPAWKDRSPNNYMGMNTNANLLTMMEFYIPFWAIYQYYRCKVGLIGTFSLKFEGMLMPFTHMGVKTDRSK